jgi:hypothetical protein
VLGTPWRDHPPQQQLSANTRATFDENRLGRTNRPSAKDAQHINRLQQQCVPLVQPAGSAPLPRCELMGIYQRAVDWNLVLVEGG